MRRALALLPSQASRPLLGVNFWSRAGGPRMWTRYDEAIVNKELQVLSDHGLTVTRSFFFWPDLMPTPDGIDEDVLDRSETFSNCTPRSDCVPYPRFWSATCPARTGIRCGATGATCTPTCGW